MTRPSLLPFAAALAATIGCGPPFIHWRLPVGWNEAIPECTSPVDSSNDEVLTNGERGAVRALGPGEIKVRCSDGDKIRVQVVGLESLTIEGPARIVLDQGPIELEDYWIKIIDVDGKELDILAYSETIAWSVSGADASLKDDTCNDMSVTFLGCKLPHIVRLRVRGPQTVRIEARLLGKTISLDVEVVEADDTPGE